MIQYWSHEFLYSNEQDAFISCVPKPLYEVFVCGKPQTLVHPYIYRNALNKRPGAYQFLELEGGRSFEGRRLFQKWIFTNI